MIPATVATETWICRRLQAPDLFAGVTTPDERRERVRAEILGRDLQHAIAGRRTGQSPETWAELFQRIYGLPLTAAGERAA